MKFNSLMHVNIIADNWDKMVDFYENKLGLTKKIEVKYKEYLDRPDRPEQQKIAQKDPEQIMYAYFEVVPGQFIEMFPNSDLPHDVEWYKRTGLNHFSLTVDDSHKTFEEFKKAGIQVISEPSKGPIRDLAILGSGPRWQPF
ncbi:MULTISPECIES: VOC family protein [Lactobacillus]|uniref:VOC family protein n=1 Tax=Lactobacillus TaxID=1578 RepID=UPI00248FA70F|nr:MULTISPECIES: VOC family protein [Lactobacillus]